MGKKGKWHFTVDHGGKHQSKRIGILKLNKPY